MTNDGFSTDPAALARHAGEFDGLAERAGKLAGDLNRTLDELGRPWGDDEVGTSFAAVYSGPSAETRTGLTGTSDHLADMGARLKAMASAYRDVDAAAHDRLRGT
jgi:uncharacterized protein YukE